MPSLSAGTDSGSGTDHWQTSWESDLPAARFRPASWDEPDAQDWADALSRAVGDGAAGDGTVRDGEPIVLVAHSLGCLAAASWLAEHGPGEVVGALFVAVPDPSGPAFPAAATVGDWPAGREILRGLVRHSARRWALSLPLTRTLCRVTDGAGSRHGIAHLRRTYLSLGLGELAAVVVFVVVQPAVAGRLADDGGRALWWAMTPLLAVVLQGGVYWLAARSWLPRAEVRGMPGGFARLYRAFRVLDVVLLAVCLAGVLLTGPSAGALVLCLLVWVFGALEYVNYFVMRLSYPVTQWFALVGRRRTPALVRDLARAP